MRQGQKEGEAARTQALEQELARREQALKEANGRVTELRARLAEAEGRLASLEAGNHEKDRKMVSFVEELEQVDRGVQPSLKCTYCKGTVKEPVTIIPCGHCFCLACKKGYSKECCKCGPKVGIDAMYRN